MEQTEKLVSLLKDRNRSISSCESFTAGLFCATLGQVPGVSAVLAGGIVTYQTRIKESVAGIDPALIERYGVVSKECAKAMAESVRDLMKTDYCVSFTGNAGPEAWEGKPAGLVYMAIAQADKTFIFEVLYPFKRNELRDHAVEDMIEQLISLIERNQVLPDIHGNTFRIQH